MRIPLLSLAALVLWTAPAIAQPATPTEPLLTLDQSLDRARRQNHDLTAARARLEQAGVAVTQAWSALFPLLVAQGKYTHNHREVAIRVPTGEAGTMPREVVIQPQDQLDGLLNASVPLVVPWAYPALRAARLNEQAGAANVQASEASVLFATAQTYYALVGAEEVLRARQSSVQVANQTLTHARARREAGAATKVEVSRAELALVRAEQAVTDATFAQAQTRRALATLIQLDKPFRVAAPDTGAPAPEAPTPQLTQRALTLRPEFRAYRLSLDSLSAQARSSAWRWAPSVSAFGQGRLFNYAGFSGDRYAWAVGGQLDWALYDAGVRDAQRRLTLAQRRETEARLDQLRSTISDDVANAQQLVAVKRSALQNAERSLALARETLDLVRAQYDAGTATQLDLLQAQDALVGADVTLAQARVDAALAVITLDRTTGAFP